MADLPTSKAKTFLEEWAVGQYEQASTDDLITMLVDLAKNVDEEFVNCSPKSEKKCEQEHYDREENRENIDAELKEAITEIRKKRVALWGVLLGGMKTVLAKNGQNSAALNNFIDEIIERVRGVSGKSAFDIPRKSKVLDHNSVWLRAQVIVVLEKHPKRKDEIIRKSGGLLGISELAVGRMIDNFKNGREPKADMANLVKTARKYFPLIIDDRLL
jgi:hypothetical protein